MQPPSWVVESVTIPEASHAIQGKLDRENRDDDLDPFKEVESKQS